MRCAASPLKGSSGFKIPPAVSNHVCGVIFFLMKVGGDVPALTQSSSGEERKHGTASTCLSRAQIAHLRDDSVQDFEKRNFTLLASPRRSCEETRGLGGRIAPHPWMTGQSPSKQNSPHSGEFPCRTV